MATIQAIPALEMAAYDVHWMPSVPQVLEARSMAPPADRSQWAVVHYSLLELLAPGVLQHGLWSTAV